jgi:hypothetical protein
VDTRNRLPDSDKFTLKLESFKKEFKKLFFNSKKKRTAKRNDS